MTERAEKRWADLVQRWKRSGLSVAEFSRREGVSPVTLGSWKRRLAGARRELPFVEVAGLALGTGRPPFQVVTGNVRVEVPQDFDAETLRVLLGVVWERP